ncbi:tRNA pseudouridine synthase Pus10, putative [Babesia caballi]|uniref:tRNA pseudouridine(55) synthase n=1 Tax=Babesia caballi TaxID=5871 RepID=A0AAV4LYG7_BABCB|nr:tRNA pseudouridine synthase Pus10, putative [Babesia caballi]
MQLPISANTGDFNAVSDVCFDCWSVLVFDNEGSECLETLREHPQLRQCFEQLSTFDRQCGATCVFCSVSASPSGSTVKDDVLFASNETLRTASIDDWQLEDIFERLAAKGENYGTQYGILLKPNVVPRGFSLGVLAVYFSRIFERDQRYLLSFAKNCIKVSLTEKAASHFNSMWSSRIATSVESLRNAAASSDSADDLGPLMRAYFDKAQNNAARRGSLDVYKRRLKELVMGILQDEFDTFVPDYQTLIRYVGRIYDEDRLLFEQLMRMQVHVSFDVDGRLRITEFKISRDVVTFSGYYNKFARGLSQTVWTLDRNVKSDLSVEECLCVPLLELCDGSGYKFMASGREDCDVRTTGAGRKFCVEIYNSKRELFLVYQLIRELGADPGSTEDCHLNKAFPMLKCMGKVAGAKEDVSVSAEGSPRRYYFLRAETQEEAVETPGSVTIARIHRGSLSDTFEGKSENSGEVPTAVGFYGLRVVFESRTERQRVQNDAENKNKVYSCVVLADEPIELEELKTLPKGPVTITQCNPIRTSHRKSQCKRERQIYEIRADPLHPRMFLLHLKTQAGTYVKEFVNGDLGRTKPSIKSMLGGRTLYVTHLDVVDFS